MPSISQLCNDFGTPPVTVLRDWAWQLYDALNARADHPAGRPDTLLPAAHNLPESPADWTAIEVAADGHLQLANLPATTLQSALLGLRHWLEPASARPAVSSDCRSESEHASPALSGPRPRRTGHQLTRRQLVRRRQVQVTCGATLVVLVVGALTYTATRPGKQVGPAQLSRASSESNSNAPAASSNTHHPARDEPEPEVVEQLSPTAPQPDLAVDALLTQSKSNSALPSTLSPDLDLKPESGARPDMSGATEERIDSSANPQASSKESAADVMQQVSEAVSQAQADEPAAGDSTGVADSGSNAAVGASQPLTLHRDQLRTRFAIRQTPAQRNKSNGLTLNLECPDGFSCQTSAEQIVQAKSTCQWRLVDNSGPTPRACLVVQAGQRNKRASDIELLFYGSAEDLPQLMVPLNRKFLDPLLINLQASQRQLQWLVDSLASSKPGPESRQQVSQQKKLAAEQLKLCKRLIEIVAQCDRLADLIDGQISFDVKMSY